MVRVVGLIRILGIVLTLARRLLESGLPSGRWYRGVEDEPTLLIGGLAQNILVSSRFLVVFLRVCEAP